MKVASKFLQNVAKFKCLGMVVTNQNCMNGKIKSRLNSGTKIEQTCTKRSDSVQAEKMDRFKVQK
jgi:hypothetical protein